MITTSLWSPNSNQRVFSVNRVKEEDMASDKKWIMSTNKIYYWQPNQISTRLILIITQIAVWLYIRNSITQRVTSRYRSIKLDSKDNFRQWSKSGEPSMSQPKWLDQRPRKAPLGSSSNSVVILSKIFNSKIKSYLHTKERRWPLKKLKRESMILTLWLSTKL